MEATVSYSLEIKDEYRCFYDTVEVYQEPGFCINNYGILIANSLSAASS